MVLYTIIPLEYIFDTDDECEERSTRKNEELEISKNGITFLVQPFNGSQAVINRLISSNAQDYLRPEWQPGSVMAL